MNLNSCRKDENLVKKKPLIKRLLSTVVVCCRLLSGKLLMINVMMYMRWTAPQSIGPKPQRHCLSHFSPQPLSPNLHAAEGEPFLAQVLQRGADRIDGVVDAEEAVVGVLELLKSSVS